MSVSKSRLQWGTGFRDQTRDVPGEEYDIHGAVNRNTTVHSRYAPSLGGNNDPYLIDAPLTIRVLSISRGRHYGRRTKLSSRRD